MLWSLFIQRGSKFWSDNVNNPEASEMVIADDIVESRVNILYHNIENATIDLAETLTIVSPVDIGNAPTEDCVIGIQVKGQIKLTWTGVDYDNASALTGYLFCKGTNLYPGILWIQSYNFNKTTGLIITSQEADTQVTVFVGMKCDDDDARLTSNA